MFHLAVIKTFAEKPLQNIKVSMIPEFFLPPSEKNLRARLLFDFKVLSFVGGNGYSLYIAFIEFPFYKVVTLARRRHKADITPGKS